MENTVNQEVTTNEPTQTPEQNERTFTQAEVDNVISERLKRERSKYSDYEELKAKAEKFDEIEEANKTELQKATERANELETKLKGLEKANEIRSIRDKVAKETGVPVDLLTGEDEESCSAQAKSILEFAKPTGYPPVKDGGEVTNISSRTPKESFSDWFGEITK